MNITKYVYRPKIDSALKTKCWQAVEHNKLAIKFLTFCKTLEINSKDKGVIPFHPDTWFGSQWLWLKELTLGIEENIHEFVYLKGRQEGITTVSIAWDIFYSFEIFNLQGTIVSSDWMVSANLRRILSDFYDSLPGGAKYRKTASNPSLIRFSNKSVIEYFYTKSRQSSKGNMGTSTSHNFGHFSEIAYFSNIEDFNNFKATLTEEYEHRLYIYESTANGFNHYYDLWENAKDSPTKKAVFLGWWTKETYALTDSRDKERYQYAANKAESAQIKLVKDMYDFDISMEQLGWWRKKLSEDVINSTGGQSKEDVMLEKYPYTEFDAFRLSGKSFFNVKILNAKKDIWTPLKSLEPVFTRKPEETILHEHTAGKIKIWEEHEESAVYVLGADPAYGSSGDSDNAVIEIFKVFRDRMVQVLEYADNLVDQFHFTWLLLILQGMYRASSIVEVNGGGKTILRQIDYFRQEIRDTRYEPENPISIYAKRMREYLYKRPDSLASMGVRQWLTTSSTKDDLMFQFHGSVENGEIEIRSSALANEMEMVSINNGYIGAQSGHHDDRVLAAAFCCEHWTKDFKARLMLQEVYERDKEKIAEEKEISNNPNVVFNKNMIEKEIYQANHPIIQENHKYDFLRRSMG